MRLSVASVCNAEFGEFRASPIAHGVRYVVMRCAACRFNWDSLIAGPDTELERCPDCGSSDVSIGALS